VKVGLISDTHGLLRPEALAAMRGCSRIVHAGDIGNREVLQAFQLSFRQLGNYIQELRSAGFDVSTLTVQWYVKIAFPLIAPVSMLLAIPYAFRVGARGAVSGVAVGLALGIAYWSLARLLQAMGGVGQMPPPFAAFAPDLIFYFLGMYFFFKMPT